MQLVYLGSPNLLLSHWRSALPSPELDWFETKSEGGRASIGENMPLVLESEAFEITLYRGRLQGKSMVCSGLKDNATTAEACMPGIQKRSSMSLTARTVERYRQEYILWVQG